LLEGGTVFVDATGAVAGRLSSHVAKRLLAGSKVVVLNAEKALITGKKDMIMGEFRKYARIQSKINPRRHGPFKARTPDRILKHMIDGMLPKKKARSRETSRRLRVYVGQPTRFDEVESQRPPEILYRRSPYGYLTLEEIARQLGWRRAGEYG